MKTLIAALLLIPSALVAFPPAPHHLFIGTVRNAQGNPMSGDDATVIFESSAGVKITSPIILGVQPGANYLLKIPMDAGITADAYQPTALRPTVPFTIRVKIGSATFLPIEMNGDFSQLGRPSGITRLDLTLGEDSDGDGLPDAWEQALIQSRADLNSLADVNPGDDSDGDGLSNLHEYISGNYAFDNEDGFSLEVTGFNDGHPMLEFLAIKGRTYSVFGSANLDKWQAINFSIAAGDEAPVRSNYHATDSRRLQIEARQTGMKFFKLKVQ